MVPAFIKPDSNTVIIAVIAGWLTMNAKIVKLTIVITRCKAYIQCGIEPSLLYAKVYLIAVPEKSSGSAIIL